jgi:hypothetical protein
MNLNDKNIIDSALLRQNPVRCQQLVTPTWLAELDPHNPTVCQACQT